jgi:hypothetical protein
MGVKSPVFELSITGDYYALRLPETIVIPFLKRKLTRVRVKVAFENKQLEFHAAIQKRKGQYLMLFGKKYQKELGIYTNDYFQLQLFEDDSKYGVEIPEEFEAVLDTDLLALEVFENFTAGKKRGIIYMIKRIANSQTRIEKSLIVCENLKRGINDNRMLLKSQ